VDELQGSLVTYIFITFHVVFYSQIAVPIVLYYAPFAS
jgi:hypothetical protein